MKSYFLAILSLFIFTFSLSAKKDDISEYIKHANTQIKNYHPNNKNYVIIIDYRKSILSERLYLLDMKKNNVVLSSTVSHAFKSGGLYAKKFSNENGTNTSSKGNFLTAGTKYGKFGYSMVLKGLDKGINDKAESRAIIFHPNTKMKTKWSYGCFATPEKINKRIIELTKNGVLVCVIV